MSSCLAADHNFADVITCKNTMLYDGIMKLEFRFTGTERDVRESELRKLFAVFDCRVSARSIVSLRWRYPSILQTIPICRVSDMMSIRPRLCKCQTVWMMRSDVCGACASVLCCVIFRAPVSERFKTASHTGIGDCEWKWWCCITRCI